MTPAGLRPTLDRRRRCRRRQVDPPTVPVEALLDPDAAGAHRPAATGPGVGPMPRRKMRPPAALIAETPPPSWSATQTLPPPKTIAPGRMSTSIRSSICPLSPSIRRTSSRAGWTPRPSRRRRRRRQTPLLQLQRLAVDPAHSATSTPRQGPVGPLVTQSEPSPAARRSGPWPTAIGAGDRDPATTEQQDQGDGEGGERRQGRERQQRRRRKRCEAPASGSPVDRGRGGPLRRARRAPASRLGAPPWRSRAASISSPAAR